MRTMMIRTMTIGALCACCVMLPRTTTAQTAAPDSAEYMKAFALVNRGEPEEGRALVDSLLGTTKAGTGAYAEGLYWRARLASMGPEAEKDYRSIIVDYSLSPRVPDALIRLGQLELTRGERESAAARFQRVVSDYPGSPQRARANYWYARAMFELNKLGRACTANAEAIAQVDSSDVELRNQIDFQSQQCRGVDLASGKDESAVDEAKAAAKDSKATKNTKETAAKGKETVAKKEPAKKKVTFEEAPDESAAVSVSDSASEPTASDETAMADEPEPTAEVAAETPDVKKTTAVKTAAGKAVKPTAKATEKIAEKSAKTEKKSAKTEKKAEPKAVSYSVQVAAFKTKEQASELATGMKAKGYSARVDGTKAPYRVRVGRFGSRTGAAAFLAKLKARGIDGFVTEE